MVNAVVAPLPQVKGESEKKPFRACLCKPLVPDCSVTGLSALEVSSSQHLLSIHEGDTHA